MVLHLPQDEQISQGKRQTLQKITSQGNQKSCSLQDLMAHNIPLPSFCVHSTGLQDVDIQMPKRTYDL